MKRIILLTLLVLAISTFWNCSEDSPTSATGGNSPDNSKMVLVEGGTYQMGSNEGATISKPVHSVTLNSFYIAKHEVTQKEWVTVMGTNPSEFTGNEERPVESISWFEALVYCNKLSISQGLTPCYKINGSTNPDSWNTIPINSSASNYNSWIAATCNWSANGYRLPSEAEWEYAARGGKNSGGYTYPGANNLQNIAWYNENSNNETKPAGQKSPNELGLYDLSGNVFEWCWDWEGSYNASPVTNPYGPTAGDGIDDAKIFRGGCYFYNFGLRVYDRNSSVTYEKDSLIGFRIVRKS